MRRNRCTSVWKRNKTNSTKIDLLEEDPSFQQLRTVSKRLAIMSRLQKKQLNEIQRRKINNTYSKIDLKSDKQQSKLQTKMKRPLTTTQTRKHNSINYVKQAYKQQKKINEHLLAEKYHTTVKSSYSNPTNSVKEGLLGEYDRYNQMSKHELIEKLISLQFLANNIFRKNKALEQKLKNLDPEIKQY